MIDTDELDPPLTVDACLGVIVPEITAHCHAKIEHALICDLGCGTGRLTNPIQARYPSAHVIGIDVNGNFLADAMRARPWDGFLPAYVRADVEDLGIITMCDDGWPDGQLTYDVVFSMAMFQHLNNVRKRSCIEAVGRAIRPGGVFVFQFVEGARSSIRMNDALTPNVTDWCDAAGLEVRRVQHDVIRPRWTWITAVRRTA